MRLTRDTEFFWRSIFKLRRDSALTLQSQVREGIVRAVLDRRLPPGSRLPATRALAQLLGVSRNTMLAAYSELVRAGYLTPEARSGHSVNPAVFKDSAHAYAAKPANASVSVDWIGRLGPFLAELPQVERPRDWQRYSYPFVYGQFDPTLFPTSEWREATQLAVRKMAVRDWAGDSIDTDDPLLVEQIQTRLLQRRGISVPPEEILVTLGSQQAMFIICALLFRRARCVGVEHPGYPDLNNLFRFFSIPTRRLPLGDGNLTKGELDGCDYVFVSPSHQNPTGRTMSLAERLELLALASRCDFVIVEDDYDSELSFHGEATPSIRALDTNGRVIYVGSLSKTIAAGLRIGYLVAPAPVIEEARALRRLMVRHPPANNQRAAALFLALGHYDALVPRLVKAYRERAQALCHALERHLPEVTFAPPRGGSALWLRAPDGFDMSKVRDRAREHGVVFDAGADFFSTPDAPLNFFRLGYSSIGAERIEPGIRTLAGCMRKV